MFRTAHKILPLIACLAVPLTASADAIGPEGEILEIELNHSSADAYLQFHGRVFIGNKQSVVEYRWGGTSCGSKILPDAMVDRLLQAMETGMEIQPRHKPGQGQTQCLVGFSFTS